ncbi:MAG: 23S rRNA (uracil(1939)-C(5))-methyltransferase RlmD [Chitinophagaceae bacterium]|jgi:23S rRNA (uracil1939-C5)-methyltransferase|nr:23S rRNA (uracil(1939)-C(5))-methyltransferase RlmD [Chitinophagaceae bacterium]
MRKKKKIILSNVLIEAYAAEGKSLARVEGKVIFAEGVVPGDLVDLRLNKNKKDWAEGTPVQFRSYSEDRVQPFCQHFGVCGGCQWQMLPYEKQLEYKQQQVTDSMKRIGKIELPEMRPIRGARETRFYRNKLEYTFGNKRYLLPGELNDEEINSQIDVAGFHARGFFDKVVDIEKCWLQPEPTNEIRNAVKAFAIDNGFSFYDIRLNHGFMRTMQVRTATTGEVMVNMVLGEADHQKIEELMHFMKISFPSISTLLYTINTKKNDSLYDLHPVVYHGSGYITEEMSTGKNDEILRFKIGPTSFFQTNTRQGEELYRITSEFADLTGAEIVYDLYCGTGSIGIFVSKLAKKIIGVETVVAAVNDAKENALINNVSHAEFFAGDVIDICNDAFFAEHGRPDVIITDPPRAGMHEKLVLKILEIEARTVVYVSCNPATQARDLNLLKEKYTVTQIQPVDMFPHTLHIENVVQLKLK